ncbi:nucleobase-ascorbate transporter 1-like isoform X2 [Nymphaea colorata]|uniref:nucleobase-ascorbate transporter 1-like isoform X2 n=1 Tax=Nymphaea colorata TaxID=210225 RepID=UPI00129DB2F8|nr:nucleobase-ascorbate transporter 1-like isoform X2 [Nymphaea colorata]
MAEISHPPQEQLTDLAFCIDSNPPWDHVIILAFQHYIVMLGTSVMLPSLLVPLMGGNDSDKANIIQTLLFVAGIKTLLQTLFGTRLPTVLGGSYAFVIPIVTIIRDSTLQRIPDPNIRFLHTIRAVQGAMIIASSLQIILGFSQIWGIFSQYFSPLSMSPVICLLGLGLLDHGFPVVGNCVEIGIPMLITVIVLCLRLKNIKTWKDEPVFERFSVLLSISIIWAYAQLLTAAGAYRHASEKTQAHCCTDKARLISSAPWIKFPYPLQWGAPTFNAGHTFAIMAGVLVSLMESTGSYIAASRFAMATPPPAHVLSRGIGWQGIGVLLDGLFGSFTGSTVSVENIGLLGLSRVGSRRVVQVSAGFMILFSVLASLGLSFLQFTNMNSMRNMFISGLSLFLGLSIPQYFNQTWLSTRHGPVHTKASWFNCILNTLFSSPPIIASIVAIFLDNTIDVDMSEKDRGMPWWAKFRSFRGDTRNEEFYTLPCNLNRFFPPG